MKTLHAASLRHLLRHPAQLLLALVGLSLGVGTIVAVDVATASARRAFELALAAVNGAATHQIVAGPGGIDERLYEKWRTEPLVPGEPRPLLAPVVSGYVTVGERLLQLVGLDPLASAALAGDGAAATRAGAELTAAGAVQAGDAASLAGGPAATAFLIQDAAQAREWFTEPGTVIMSAATAAELGIAPGSRFELAVGGIHHSAILMASLSGGGAGFDGLLLTDIAQAQEWLGLTGRLSRIDVRLPAGAAGAPLLARLTVQLPAGLALHATRAAARETFAMTDAFTINLRAMSLLALLVGTLLIYAAMSFAVLQRRRIIGVLRALGATRREVLTVVLAEAAALGVAGALCGLLLGVLIGRGLVALVARTINDLYFVVAVKEVSLPPAALVAAVAVGIASALLAALLPALEAAGSSPQLALTRSVLERRALHLAGRLAIVSLLLALAAGLVLAGSSRSLLAGFVALFLLLLAAAAITPAALRMLAAGGARLGAGWSPMVRLACAEIATSLSRTGVASAALGMALTAMIGVAVMVESFRESLRSWLLETLRADVYVSAPGYTEGIERRLDPQLVRALLAAPGIRAHSEGRRVTVDSPTGPLDLNAVRLVPPSYAGFRFTRGDPARAWPQFARGAVLVSEPLAWRLSLAPDDPLALITASGPQTFTVAGVYREYGNDRGEVLMDLATYRRWWNDPDIAALGLNLAPAVTAAQVVGELRAAARGRQALLIRSNADLRALSMSIFERTFVITRVLYWLAAGVAAVGLLSALLAWELERGRALALLRTLGLTPGGTAALVIAQTAFMGLAAFLAAIPAGLLTALILTDVINRRAFGWQINLHLTAAQLGSALALALTAALAAGAYPAWRSARMTLATALREE